MKPCSICKTILSLDQFNKSARRKDGHRGECKECQKAAALEREEVVNTTYRDRIISVLKERGGPIDIHALRGEFAKTVSVQYGVSSALKNMSDRGEISVTGIGHGKTAKMIALVTSVPVPQGRIIRLSDERHWNLPKIRTSGVMLQSSMNSVFAF